VEKDGTIVLYVLYSGRKQNVGKLLKALRSAGADLDEDILRKAIRLFERQNEVDYFISKNARQFLREQFDMWLYQYVHSDDTAFTERRVKQLKVLKEVAYKIIDFVAQFEDELVKIWRKPKFVLKSGYVITLDRIAKRDGGISVIERIVKSLNAEMDKFRERLDVLRDVRAQHRTYVERFEAIHPQNQIEEWYLLDLIDEDFDPNSIITNTVVGKGLNPQYQFLPIDTRYFKDLEYDILGLFDDLEDELDGWLIRSENWQALNTVLPKFKEQVKLIYIDPPFNTGSNEFTMYINRFLDSAWITMIENRLSLAKDFLARDGSIFVRIDYHGDHYLRFLLDEIFGKDNFRNEIAVRRFKKNVMEKDVTIYCYSKTDAFTYVSPFKKRKEARKGYWRHMGDSSGRL